VLDVAIHDGDLAEVGGDGEHHGHGVDVVEECVRYGDGRIAGGHAERERSLAGRLRARVLLPHRAHERGHRLPDSGVLHHRHAPRLLVAATGREAGVVEDGRHDVAADRLVGEAANGPRGA
jgi:hypothetical protein